MTVGEYLRKLREEKGITLEQVAGETNIRLNYLQAIENDQLDQLPSLPQAKGFTRLYAAYLGLSSRDVFEEVEKINKPEQPGGEENTGAPAVPPILLVEKKPAVTGKKGKRKSEESKMSGSHPAINVVSETELPLSQVIFNEIGKELKRQREALGLSLADVERLTKIREFFAYALENGQIDDLPSTVQGRGMLNNYASFLNLNAESLQLRYAEGLQQKRQEKFQLDQQDRKSGARVIGKAPLSGWRRFLTPDLLVGGTVFLALFGLVIWGAMVMIRTTNPQVEPTISSISEILVGNLTPSPASGTQQPADLFPGVTGTPAVISTSPVDLAATLSVSGSGSIQIVVVANQRAYMQVTVDGENAFTGRVVPGNIYSYSGNNMITLLTGNASALQVIYNQQDQGILGTMGEVIELEFTKNAMVTPTPRFSPTPTQTPLPTLTALPTNTSLPSPTMPTVTITPARTPGP